MKKSLYSFLSFLLVAGLASCSSESKKVVVMASGKVQVSGNTVTVEPGSTHNEVTVEPDGDSVIVNDGSSAKGYAVPQGGLYLLNLKKDTLVGSYQRVGTDNSRQVISQDDLFNRVDSLNQLMAGTNVSAEAKNYNIPPANIARISDNANAQIVGPFRKLPGSFDPSKEHEVYKFYTNKEVVEIVNNVKKMLSDQ